MKIIKAALAVLFALAVVAGCSAGNDSTGDGGVSTGAGSQDASADVQVASYEGPDALGFYNGTLSVTNNSSKTSDYYVELNVLDDAGTVLGMTNAIVSNLAPGANAAPSFTVVEAGGSHVVVTEVQRTASV